MNLVLPGMLKWNLERLDFFNLSFVLCLWDHLIFILNYEIMRLNLMKTCMKVKRMLMWAPKSTLWTDRVHIYHNVLQNDISEEKNMCGQSFRRI